MRFSERIGIVSRVLQKESMDQSLKNALWNVIYMRFWAPYARVHREMVADVPAGLLLHAIWCDHFNFAADDAHLVLLDHLQQVKPAYVNSTWWEAYDLVQFVVDYPRPSPANDQLIADFNAVLKKHLSAYRFVGSTLAPITSEEEIAAIEQAMSYGDQFGPVGAHLETALARLADRSAPDYRNSIKESISAVESACQTITGDAKATLGQALKELGIHPALEKGFSAIYGYTSDADGIRHALSEESVLDADDAKFFLVSCSAFVNYLIAKSTAITSP